MIILKQGIFKKISMGDSGYIIQDNPYFLFLSKADRISESLFFRVNEVYFLL